MHNVLGQNVWIFSLCIHCLQKESASFGLRVLIDFGHRVSRHFWLKESYKKH